MQLSVLPDFALGRGEAHLEAMRGKAKDPAAQRARLEAAAKEFEGIMMEMMLKEMRKTVPDSPLLGKSNAEDIYQSMLDSQYVHLMEDRGGLGLAQLLVQQLGPELPGARGAKAGAGHPAPGAHAARPVHPVHPEHSAQPSAVPQAAQPGAFLYRAGALPPGWPY
jgi:Rod binding domain-containing protein